MLFRGKYWRVLLMGFAFFAACNNSDHQGRTIDRSFYYWKSTYSSNHYAARLDSLAVNTLYLKYFDVDWDDVARQPMPKAMIRFKNQPVYNIIPTVFITNECLQRADSLQIQLLGEKIIQTIKSINESNSIHGITEIQIDCDWSAATRNNYFKLLSVIKNSLKSALQSDAGHIQILLSATIRLYQVKYKDKAGVPPADRGMLMCYNMGNLKSINSNNSIIETAELKKYTGQLEDYPLPLDIALPIFNWKVWFRNEQYHGITEEFPDALLASSFFQKSGNRYVARHDSLLAGYDFKKGDQLRYEVSDVSTISACAETITNKLKNTRMRVALYHLDSLILEKYTLHELENIYNSLR